MLNVKVI